MSESKVMKKFHHRMGEGAEQLINQLAAFAILGNIFLPAPPVLFIK
jgi:hypothetical protein